MSSRAQSRNNHTPFVAETPGGERVAWISMRDDGYIDMLFCAPEAAGRGVAAQLYATISHASLLARPFFGKHGWVVDAHEDVERNGVMLPRAAMSKVLV